jgi:hypothetical protein
VPSRVPNALPGIVSTPRSAPVTPSEVPARPTPAPTPTEAPALAPQTPTPVTVTPTPAGTPALSPTLPAEARLIVVVAPWAEVFVDGERRGLTPLPALSLRPGSHVVELRHPDFRPLLRTMELKSGEQIRMSVNLRIEAIRR